MGIFFAAIIGALFGIVSVVGYLYSVNPVIKWTK